MKGQIAKLFGATSAIAFVVTNASAHPGHAPTDVAAQLAAPSAGADHLMVFGAIAVMAALVITRVALYLIERRNRLRPLRSR